MFTLFTLFTMICDPGQSFQGQNWVCPERSPRTEGHGILVMTLTSGVLDKRVARVAVGKGLAFSSLSLRL